MQKDLHFDVDDNSGQDGFGIEIFYDTKDNDLLIEIYSDSGNGTCVFAGDNLEKLLSAFEEIKKARSPAEN